MEFLVGLIPIILFLILLAVLKKSALFSTYASLTVAIILNFVMSSWRIPVQGIIASLFEGFAVAWMPIGFVIIAAIFAYDLSVKNGKIEIIKTMLGNITSDRRAQALILAWGFGGFIEGIAGYGTAVAIPAAIMIFSYDSGNDLFTCKFDTDSIWNSRTSSYNNDFKFWIKCSTDSIIYIIAIVTINLCYSFYFSSFCK